MVGSALRGVDQDHLSTAAQYTKRQPFAINEGANEEEGARGRVDGAKGCVRYDYATLADDDQR